MPMMEMTPVGVGGLTVARAGGLAGIDETHAFLRHVDLGGLPGRLGGAWSDVGD
jgi:hypothetical protein